MASCCMKYTWRMQIFGKANEFLHADFVAEIGALICKVYKQVIGRNTWLSFALIIPGKCTLLERQMNFCMQPFCRNWSSYLQGL